MNQKEEAIALANAGELTISEIARTIGRPRPTVNKWLQEAEINKSGLPGTGWSIDLSTRWTPVPLRLT